MTISLRLVAASAIAAAGLGAAFASGGYGAGGFGTIRAPAAAIAAPGDAVTSKDLSDWLAEIRRSLVIRPDQEPAWRDYAEAMRYLDQATTDFEQRRANADALDVDKERSRHALLLGAAIGDLQRSLSPDQFARARRLTEDLASVVTCAALREP